MTLINWAGLIVNGAVSFVLPLLAALLALGVKEPWSPTACARAACGERPDAPAADAELADDAACDAAAPPPTVLKVRARRSRATGWDRIPRSHASSSPHTTKRRG